jgi:hypothetical protein
MFNSSTESVEKSPINKHKEKLTFYDQIKELNLQENELKEARKKYKDDQLENLVNDYKSMQPQKKTAKKKKCNIL